MPSSNAPPFIISCDADVEPLMMTPLPNDDPSFGIEVSPSKRRCLPPRRPLAPITPNTSRSGPQLRYPLKDISSFVAAIPISFRLDRDEVKQELQLEWKECPRWSHAPASKKLPCFPVQRSTISPSRPGRSPSEPYTQSQWRRQLVNMRGRALAYGPLSPEESAFFDISMDFPAMLHAWTELWQRRKARFTATGSVQPSLLDSMDGRVCDFGLREHVLKTFNAQAASVHDIPVQVMSDTDSPNSDVSVKPYVRPYRTASGRATEAMDTSSPISSPCGGMVNWRTSLPPRDSFTANQARSRTNNSGLMEGLQDELPSPMSDVEDEDEMYVDDDGDLCFGSPDR